MSTATSTTSDRTLTGAEVRLVVSQLAKSQGFYGRVLQHFDENELYTWDDVAAEGKFKDELDVVFFFES